MLNKILQNLKNYPDDECYQIRKNIYKNKDLYKYVCNIYDYVLKNNKNKKYEAIKDSLAGAYTIIATAVYVTLGIMLKDNNGWKYFWFLFLLIPVIPSICIMIYKRKITAFCYPMAIAAAYCGFSMYYNLWHPLWILFLTIPVFYIVFCPIDKLITKIKMMKINNSINNCILLSIILKSILINKFKIIKNDTFLFFDK